MGIDAKGRNFSAPRLTPGKHQELMTYGSPAMIKEQDRQIAIMEDRARRYGYMSSARAAQMGGYTARPLGTSEGYNRPPAAARTTSFAGSTATRTTSYANRTAANNADAKKIVKFIIIFFIILQVLPMLMALLFGLIGAAGEL